MKNRLTGIYCLSVAAALLMGMGAECAQSQEAGPAPPERLNEVVVTGSRIPQVGLYSSSPVQVIGSGELTASQKQQLTMPEQESYESTSR